MNVLVVDEYPEGGTLLVELLGLYGHSSRCVHSVSDAVGMLEAQPCDALLIDLHLPKGAAFELATTARSKAMKSLLLIGMGAASIDFPPLTLFDHVMEKPLDFARLEAVLGQTQ
jgi:DNA-binding response OmpR family regulator